MDLEKLISTALRQGSDVTITIRQRRDGRVGDLMLPLDWARALGRKYDLMTDPAMARIAPSGGCVTHRGDPSPFCGSCEASDNA